MLLNLLIAELNDVISEVKRLIASTNSSANNCSVSSLVRSLVSKKYKTRAAGRTSELVDEVIAKHRARKQ